MFGYLFIGDTQAVFFVICKCQTQYLAVCILIKSRVGMPSQYFFVWDLIPFICEHPSKEEDENKKKEFFQKLSADLTFIFDAAVCEMISGSYIDAAEADGTVNSPAAVAFTL